MCFESQKQRRVSSYLEICESTRSQLKGLADRYDGLKRKCNNFSEKLENAIDHQKDYNDQSGKVNRFLAEAEARFGSLEAPKMSGDPAELEKQLVNVKAFGAEVITRGQQVEHLRKSAKDFVESLADLGGDGANSEAVESCVSSADNRLTSLTTRNTQLANRLQTAVVRSQGVVGGIKKLLRWVGDSEGSLKGMRPITLDQNLLSVQVQELQLLKADVENHRPGIASISADATEFMKSCTDSEKGDEIRESVADLNSRFDRLSEACSKREADLQSISSKLSRFDDMVKHHNARLTPIFELLDSKEHISEAVLGELNRACIEEESTLKQLQTVLEELVENPATADAGKLQDAFADVSQNWKELQDTLCIRVDEEKSCSEKGVRFDLLRAAVVEWLDRKEIEVDQLEPVLVEVDVIQSQIQKLTVRLVFLYPQNIITLSMFYK